MTALTVRFGVLVTALLLLSTERSSAQTEAWNQEKVTALAGELESAVAGLRDALRKNPMWENPQQKAPLYRLADKLRLIESECASLHARLAKGEGMEETQPAYEHIQRLRRDAEVEGSRTEVSTFIRPKLDRAREVLSMIAPFYPAAPARKEAPKS